MAEQQPTKISDVNDPAKVTPSATARPIVAPRSIMVNDPMVAPAVGNDVLPPKPAEPMARTAKTIIPISADLSAELKEATPKDTKAEVPADAATASPAPDAPKPKAISVTEATKTEATAPPELPTAAAVPASPIEPAKADASAKPAADDSTKASNLAPDSAPATPVGVPAETLADTAADDAPEEVRKLGSTPALSEAMLKSAPELMIHGPVTEFIPAKGAKTDGKIDEPAKQSAALKPATDTDAPATKAEESTGVTPDNTAEAVTSGAVSKSTIQPVTPDLTALTRPGPKPELAPEGAESATPDTKDKDIKDAAAPTALEPPEEAAPTTGRDAEAEVAAEEIQASEAKTAREQELEQIIASGKYHLPINAVRRRRSHMNIVFLGLFALVLIAALLDVLVDMGVLSLPFDVPTTHFFTT